MGYSEDISHLHHAADYKQLRDKYVRKYIKLKLEKIEQQLRCYDFESADGLFKDISHLHHAADYEQLRRRYEDEYVTSKFNQIEQRLRLYDFEGADELFKDISHLYAQVEYENLKEKYIKKRMLENITALLNDGKYITADKCYLKLKSSLISVAEYETLKSRYVKRSIAHKRLELNNEQSLAIAKNGQASATCSTGGVRKNKDY